ncbi:hypothetical protein LV779_37890 [Streptomyces thinghirensis]|nr:hypothetical protein [Streptomyces thinghirensis]
MSISEPLDDPWADNGPSDRLPASRRRGDGDRSRDEQHEARFGQRRLGRRRAVVRAGAAAGPGRRGSPSSVACSSIQGRHRRCRRDPQGPRLHKPAHETGLPGHPRRLRQG